MIPTLTLLGTLNVVRCEEYEGVGLVKIFASREPKRDGNILTDMGDAAILDQILLTTVSRPSSCILLGGLCELIVGEGDEGDVRSRMCRVGGGRRSPGRLFLQ
jgi:hypothetical protein